MIEVTEQQRQELEVKGKVRVSDAQTKQEYVLLRADVYERMRAVFEDDALDSTQIGKLVEQTMREYDEGDPLLESYQKYRP